MGIQHTDAGTYAPDDLHGMDVCDAGGEKAGTVEGAWVDEGSATRYLAIRTGWLGTKRHVVPIDDVRLDTESNVLRLPYDRDRLRNGPSVSRDTRDLSGRDEENIYAYYGLRGYWEAVRAKQATPSATPEIAEADVAEAMAERDAGPIRARRLDPDAGRDVRDPDDPGRHGGMVAAGHDPAGADGRRVRWYERP